MAKAIDKEYLLTQLRNFDDDILENKYADLTDLAPAFSTSTAYSRGDYVTYDGDLYVFTVDHPAGAWKGTSFSGDVARTDVATELDHTGFDSGDFTKAEDITLFTDPPTYTVLLNKSTTPTQNDTKAITSGAVYTALSNKTDKVTSATSGNFAGLDSNGNLTDSGKSANNFLANTYLDQIVTTVANTETTVTFTNNLITSDKVIDVFAGRSTGDVSGAQNVFPYKDIYVDNTNHTCTITYPALDSAISLKVRIYIH